MNLDIRLAFRESRWLPLRAHSVASQHLSLPSLRNLLHHRCRAVVFSWGSGGVFEQCSTCRSNRLREERSTASSRGTTVASLKGVHLPLSVHNDCAPGLTIWSTLRADCTYKITESIFHRTAMFLKWHTVWCRNISYRPTRTRLYSIRIHIISYNIVWDCRSSCGLYSY